MKVRKFYVGDCLTFRVDTHRGIDVDTLTELLQWPVPAYVGIHSFFGSLSHKLK